MLIYIWDCYETGITSDPFLSKGNCEASAERYLDTVNSAVKIAIYEYNSENISEVDGRMLSTTIETYSN